MADELWTAVSQVKVGDRITLKNQPTYRCRRWFEFWRPRLIETGRKDVEMVVREVAGSPRSSIG